ncbi:lysozyme [Umezawaea tangerina]|uniref:Lysozyme n=1 Tax=Umezawaea tangerina TaxID=84725 RepID=A0A2T0SGZ8_9PSEU|nr:lysozyme [Umezawaea tangerina]PRY32691.1 lysozyme [Umezawaea tangerina]
MNPLVRSAVALAACTGLLVTAFSPVNAAPAVPKKDQAVQQDHAMGSQIRKHEGGARLRVKPRKDPSIQATVAGIDVSGYQGNVDWAAYWNQGKQFAYVKATESTGYVNPYFAQQYNGSYNVGMIRGAYHFALPDRSSGAAQADYFIAHGGGWSPDGRTLPGALDAEYNPYGSTCYGLSKAAMTNWMLDFSDTYRARTGVFPVIYTSTSWWNQCVNAGFSTTNPLWVARYASAVGALPYDWGNYTMWQYSSSPIDQNQFNGGYDRLQALAFG